MNQINRDLNKYLLCICFTLNMFVLFGQNKPNLRYKIISIATVSDAVLQRNKLIVLKVFNNGDSFESVRIAQGQIFTAEKDTITFQHLSVYYIKDAPSKNITIDSIGNKKIKYKIDVPPKSFSELKIVAICNDPTWELPLVNGFVTFLPGNFVDYAAPDNLHSSQSDIQNKNKEQNDSIGYSFKDSTLGSRLFIIGAKNDKAAKKEASDAYEGIILRALIHRWYKSGQAKILFDDNLGSEQIKKKIGLDGCLEKDTIIELKTKNNGCIYVKIKTCKSAGNKQQFFELSLDIYCKKK